MHHSQKDISTSIAPWLSVQNAKQAVVFYQSAFNATEVFRLEDPGGGIVSRLAIDGAEFWVSDESKEHGNFSPPSLGGSTVRMIVVVADPDTLFTRAIKTGATQISPVSEGHGWRVGRLADPFGHDWEIGRPV
jgi:PhnB protein